MKLPISCLILTFNEENNIGECLESISGLVDEIIILDSKSTDKTIEISRKYTDKIFYNDFLNYSQQRNWGLDNIHFANEWVMNLDADQRVSKELGDELSYIFNKGTIKELNGFIIKRKTIFMNRWIRYGGHYSSYYAPLFKKGYGRCENRLYDQHFIITGAVKLLKQPVIDIISDSLTRFTERHNRWATLEAQEILCAKKDNIKLKSSFLGNKMQQKRKLKDIYYKMPLFLRAFLYYFYRYIIKLGFLDGYEGLIFHFLQGFWFRFLVDAKIFELKRQQKHTLPT